MDLGKQLAICMKIVSWNVNGIRACLKKGFRDYVESEQPDVLCLQEVKAKAEQVDLEWASELGYSIHWNSATKKGYSGTAIFSKLQAEHVVNGMGIEEHDDEGRVISAEYPEFTLVNVYTPNSKRGLARLDYRMDWDRVFLDFVVTLNEKKPVIYCGDLNCAHKEIDLANPKANKKNAGFSAEERSGLDAMVEAGFVDSFRQFDQSEGKYSWWTVRVNARERNIGWRLDYFWVAQSIVDKIKDAQIRDDIFGSDHCPVEITID